MSQHKIRPVLDSFYSIKDFFVHIDFAEYLRWYLLCEAYLPTEIVITEPQSVAPKVARIFKTDYFWVGGKVIDHSELLKIPNFRGVVDYNPIYLFELWEDQGADGHVAFEHWGYMFCADITPTTVYSKNALNDKYMDWRYKIEEEERGRG